MGFEVKRYNLLMRIGYLKRDMVGKKMEVLAIVDFFGVRLIGRLTKGLQKTENWRDG